MTLSLSSPCFKVDEQTWVRNGCNVRLSRGLTFSGVVIVENGRHVRATVRVPHFYDRLLPGFGWFNSRVGLQR